MKILIDVGHPAHVHIFKNFTREMQNHKHIVFFTCRSKGVAQDLLVQEGFEYTCIGSNRISKTGKLLGMFRFTWLIYKVSLHFKPDVLLSHGSIYAAFTSFLINRPHISIEDTFNFEQLCLYRPFTKVILTSNYIHPLKSTKVVRYSGYHELAYLHSNRFTPDKKIIGELGLREDEHFIIIRFVSRTSTHDIGHKGMSLANKIAAVKALSIHAKVFISSETPLPHILETFRFPLSSPRMHHAIAFASLVFGESATMASEAAILGTHAIYIDKIGRLYTKELQVKYNLVFNYSESDDDQRKAIEKGVEILTTHSIKVQGKIKRDRILADNIDVTSFFVWFIENYPDSHRIMKENPDYQYNFR